MKPEEKFNTAMWWTLQAIKDQLLLTPKEERVKLDVAHLTNIDPHSPRMDVIGGCMGKLDEWGVIKVLDKYDQFGLDPYYGSTDWSRANGFEFIVYQQKFDELYRKYESTFENPKQTQQEIKYPLITPLGELNRDNFLAVADVVLDIQEKLQMTDGGVVWIPIIRNLVRFKELYPVHSVQQMDNYGDARMRGLGYLKKCGHIEDYESINDDGAHRWEGKIKISVNESVFSKFYKEFKIIYKTKNIAFPIQDESENVAAPIETKNDAQVLADKLDKDFGKDKENVEISRAWFEAMANNAKPALEAYQTYVAQTLINLEPFRRRLAENAKVIYQISQNGTLLNLEAIKPMLKEIEDSLNRVSKFYAPPQKMTIAAPLPPKISEAVQRNEIITEIRALRNQVEKLTDVKNPVERKVKPPREDNLLLTKELKPQITAGKLAAYSDGTIRYNDKILDLRNQLKDLCRFFMRNPKRLLTIDDIREEIVNADKRKTTPNSTIAKYVSELRNSLKIHFQKEVIFNQKEEGWYFRPSD